jgi:hypothetical protein
MRLGDTQLDFQRVDRAVRGLQAHQGKASPLIIDQIVDRALQLALALQVHVGPAFDTAVTRVRCSRADPCRDIPVDLGLLGLHH